MKKYRFLLLLLPLGLLIYLVHLASYKKLAPTKPLNVILISIDALQAKHLDEYGYSLKTTPNLDSLLDSSYLFLNAVSPSSWTVPTHMSVFTSMYPSEHKVVNKYLDYNPATKTGTIANLKNLTPSAVTLAEIFKNNGYVTAGFTGDAGVGKQFGFGQGFDEYYDAVTFGGFDGSMPKALDWLAKNKDNKFFLFLHGYDVHGQYAPPGGFDYRYVTKPYTGLYTGSPAEQAALREEGLKNGSLNLSPQDVAFWRAVYDEKINRMDAEFGNFMDQVKKLGLLDNTVIIVFSDHGTEFYEHKRFDHGDTLYGELVDVLFAIHLPGQNEGKKITSLVSTLDITPTVLKLVNIKNPVTAQVKGTDLTPSFNGTDVSHDVYTETDYRLYTHKRAVQTPDGWKFILTMETQGKELYNLNNDLGELVNLVDKEPKKAYEMEQMVYKHLKDMNAADGPWVLGCSPAYANQCQ